MHVWWTETAIRQYQKYAGDSSVRAAFDDLIEFFCENPNRGARLGELISLTDRHHQRVSSALAGMDLGVDARVVIATVPPPPKPNPPPVLAVAVHVAWRPEGVVADHSLLLLGVIPRQAPVVV